MKQQKIITIKRRNRIKAIKGNIRRLCIVLQLDTAPYSLPPDRADIALGYVKY